MCASTLWGNIASSLSPEIPSLTSSALASSLVLPLIKASVCARKLARRIYKITEKLIITIRKKILEKSFVIIIIIIIVIRSLRLYYIACSNYQCVFLSIHWHSILTQIIQVIIIGMLNDLVSYEIVQYHYRILNF